MWDIFALARLGPLGETEAGLFCPFGPPQSTGSGWNSTTPIPPTSVASPTRADAAAAGGYLIGSIVGCAAAGYGLGSLVGLAVPAGLAGLFVGVVVGLALVYARFSD
jgi:hypothetical protein